MDSTTRRGGANVNRTRGGGGRFRGGPGRGGPRRGGGGCRGRGRGSGARGRGRGAWPTNSLGNNRTQYEHVPFSHENHYSYPELENVPFLPYENQYGGGHDNQYLYEGFGDPLSNFEQQAFDVASGWYAESAGFYPEMDDFAMHHDADGFFHNELEGSAFYDHEQFGGFPGLPPPPPPISSAVPRGGLQDAAHRNKENGSHGLNRDHKGFHGRDTDGLCKTDPRKNTNNAKSEHGRGFSDRHWGREGETSGVSRPKHGVTHGGGRNRELAFFGGRRGENNSIRVSPLERRKRGNSDEGLAANEDLRTKLTRQLSRESYECLVCCEHVRIVDSVWHCGGCFAVFHLKCIRRWASTSLHQEGGEGGPGWRCPACSRTSRPIPYEYWCFCGKVKNPRMGYHADAPHSCGQICKRKGRGDCPHRCVLQCHPGPCPSCPKLADRPCNCGRTMVKIRCGSEDVVQCTVVCGKALSCGVHTCPLVCHTGECAPCQEVVKQVCYCQSQGRKVPCTTENAGVDSYACNRICGKMLLCGHHTCERTCHDGPCPECERGVEVVNDCPCGKMRIEHGSRTECTDPIATCGQPCGKELICGPEAEPHKCTALCHEGPCPPCNGVSPRLCRCGANVVDIPCPDLMGYFDSEVPILCDRRCLKKKSCKTHKCQDFCCTSRDHLCMNVCDKVLNCGVHKCEQLCHIGRCQPCLQATFQEVYCHCGSEVLHPPVPCGSRPPPCSKPCAREHPCEHPVYHTCHSEESCPPCTHLTERLCLGGHENRRNIPCHIGDVTCGRPCGAKLPCGHGCLRSCHKHVTDEVYPCLAKCSRARPGCGHPCEEPCHGSEPCPGTRCKEMVELSCPCGVQKREVTCHEATTLWDKAKKARLMASQVESMEGGTLVLRVNSSEKHVTLQCLPECEVIARNKRFAEALQINDFDQRETQAPVYTDFLKQQMATNPTFVLSVERALVDLVGRVKAMPSAGKRSHQFPSANRDNRHVIHEYAEYFGMSTQAYDLEPNRNVVATATASSAVPAKLLSQVVEQRSNPRKPKLLIPPTLVDFDDV